MEKRILLEKRGRNPSEVSIREKYQLFTKNFFVCVCNLDANE